MQKPEPQSHCEATSYTATITAGAERGRGPCSPRRSALETLRRSGTAASLRQVISWCEVDNLAWLEHEVFLWRPI